MGVIGENVFPNEMTVEKATIYHALNIYVRRRNKDSLNLMKEKNKKEESPSNHN